MTSILKSMFSCFLRKRRISDAIEATGCPRDIIYITVPRKNFLEFLANRPAHWRLDLASFMALYKYATEDFTSNPGPGYTYEKFVFLVDGQYVRVEGWVPMADIFDYFETAAEKIAKPVSGRSSKERIQTVQKSTDGSDGACVKYGKRGRDVLCVNIDGKVTKAEEMLCIQKTASAFASRRSERAALSKYSRHMTALYRE